LSDIDGSAATPAIRGTDANTGIFFPAADTIGFAEGGVGGYARFDSSGNLGIGTATPTAQFQTNSTRMVVELIATGNRTTSGAIHSTGLGLNIDTK
jgi:hypothetical protein